MSDEMDMDELEEFEAWRDELSHELHLAAIQRALHQLDWIYRLEPGGVLVVHDDVDFESDEFQETIHQVFMDMYWRDAMEELANEGSIVACGIDGDGNILYATAT